MDWGLVDSGCWSARLEEKPSSNLDRKRGIEFSCFAKNTLLSSDSSLLRYFFMMPGVILSDIRGCRFTSAAVPLSNCLVQGRGIDFSFRILPFPIYIYLSTVLRSFSLGVLILLFFLIFLPGFLNRSGYVRAMLSYDRKPDNNSIGRQNFYCSVRLVHRHYVRLQPILASWGLENSNDE